MVKSGLFFLNKRLKGAVERSPRPLIGISDTEVNPKV